MILDLDVSNKGCNFILQFNSLVSKYTAGVSDESLCYVCWLFCVINDYINA